MGVRRRTNGSEEALQSHGDKEVPKREMWRRDRGGGVGGERSI